jgi:hypothetical protein
MAQKNFKYLAILLNRMAFPIMSLLITMIMPSEYFNMDLKNYKELKK